LADRLTKLGVQFEILQYPPETTDFTVIVADLNNRVTAAVQNYGNNQVGVVLFAGDEGALLIHDSASYNALKHVKWFGSDGTEGSGYFIQDTTVAQFNIQTRMVHPVFNPTFTNITQKVRQYIISQLGREPDQYAYVAYDIAWVLIKAIVEVDAYDPVKVNQVLPQVASQLFGATGWLNLDQNHDRLGGDYGLWTIVNQNGTYQWVQVGLYSFTSDSITWYPGYEYLSK